MLAFISKNEVSIYIDSYRHIDIYIHYFHNIQYNQKIKNNSFIVFNASWSSVTFTCFKIPFNKWFVQTRIQTRLFLFFKYLLYLQLLPPFILFLFFCLLFFFLIDLAKCLPVLLLLISIIFCGCCPFLYCGRPTILSICKGTILWH